MKRVAVIVPVKGGRYKSRLSRSIGPMERSELSTLLLKDLLRTIAGAGLISDTFVVSSSANMREVARSLDAKAVPEKRDSGVNSAVQAAVSSLDGYRDFLILPSDLPLLTSSDVRKALSLKRAGMDVVISPSASFDGTNLLMIDRSHSIELSYDNNSFWNHVRISAASGFSMAVYTSRGVMLDVDTERDVREILQTRVHTKSTSFLRDRSRFK